MPDWMIETENLTKRFPCSATKDRGGDVPGAGDPAWFTAVDGVSLQVPAGEILALLGPNGAGKTTTVRMLAGILQPSAGRARVAGLDTVGQARQVRQVIGLLTEFPGLYLRMRAGEYLAFFGELQGLDAATIRSRTEALGERFGLAGNLSQRLAEYSKGMRQKLALIRAMLHDPDLLLLDEPTSALDPQGARQVRDAILDLRRERRTVLLCTHNLAEAELLAGRIAIIHRSLSNVSFLPSLTTGGLLLHNVRVLLLAAVLAVISLGVLPILLLMMPMALVGFIAGQVAAQGLDPVAFLAAFVAPHGLLEIPAAVLATAFALRVGASVTAPPPGMTVGEHLLATAADLIKVFVFLVLPLLCLAAFVEANVTPEVVLWIYGG